MASRKARLILNVSLDGGLNVCMIYIYIERDVCACVPACLPAIDS